MNETSGNPADWQVQLLRVTTFFASASPVVDTLWHDLTGQDPDVDEHRPKEAVRRQIGLYGEGQLETQISGGRLDVMVTPRVPTAPTGRSYIGPQQREIEAFRPIAHRTLHLAEPMSIARVAFGAILLLPSASRKETYGELDRLLVSVDVDSENTKEFFYRINRPRPSRVLGHGHLLNRMNSWSSLAVRSMVPLPASEAPSAQGMKIVLEEHFLRLEIDNSTAAENTEGLDSSKLVAIYEELIEMAAENAAKGERP